MTDRSDQITQLKAAMEALEAQRPFLGDEAVDLGLEGMHQKLAQLETKSSTDSQIEGERRQATILFSDLSGYTAMNEKLDPEEVERIMNRIKEAAIRIIESHRGTVNQFVGDEIVALFGIPHAHEDDPSRAVISALDLHAMVREMSEEVELLIGRPLTMHSGINTGLIVTALRDDRDGKFGITGDAVNTGARVRAQAKADEILVSPETQRLIAPYFKTISMEPVNMKGKSQLMVPYRILEKTAIQTRIEAAEQRGFTAYTGRDEEMAILNACLEKTLRGEGQFVTLRGDAGVGKSRMIYEFRHSLDREQVNLLEGRTQAYGSDTSFLPYLDALRRGLHLREKDSPAELLEKVISNLKVISPELEEYLPVFLHLLSIPSDYSLPAHLRGEELRKAMREALATILTLNSQLQPMVFIMEDWHWSDEASRAALKHLITVNASYPLMVIVTYRPDYMENWEELSSHTPIVLNPLDAPHTKNIVKSILGTESLPEGLGLLIHERTGGNPFFIEEICNALIEENIVVVKEGIASLTRSLEKLNLPDTVQAIIRSRLDRMNSDIKETLRLASVIGRTFAKRILEQLYSARIALSESLEILKALEVIQQIRNLPEAEYIFKHVLTQQVTYETLLLQQRKELHGAVGQVIEKLYSQRLEEHTAILAYHYIRSELNDKAIEYAILAGDQAARLYANSEASTYFEEALTLSKSLPASPEAQGQQIDIVLKLAAVGITQQDVKRDLENLKQAHQLAKTLNNPYRLAQVLYWLGRVHYVLLDSRVAIDYTRQSLDIAEELGDETLAAPCVNLLGRLYWQISNFVQASQMMERSVKQMQQLSDKTEESTATGFLGYLLAHLGEIDRAIPYVNHSVQLAQEIRNPFAEAAAWMFQGGAMDQKGEWNEAITGYEKGIHLAEQSGDLFRAFLLKFWKGRADTLNGHPERALVSIKEAIALVEKIGTRFGIGLQKMSYASCLLKLGELNQALSLSEEAIRLTEEAEDKYFYSLAYRNLAETYFSLNSSDFDKIEPAMQEAIRIQQDTGFKPELARSYLSYAQILMSKGDQKSAQEYYLQATTMFEQMGMAWDLEQAKL